MRVKYNIHHAINYRSWRKGMINNLNFKWKAIHFRLTGITEHHILQAMLYPRNGYGIYYPNIVGKNHSNYPKFKL